MAGGAAAGYRRIWRAADKIVYSASLGQVSTPRTRQERQFQPDAVRRLKAVADHDLSIGGAELAGQAIGAGLIDEIRLLLTPVAVGAGKRAMPVDAIVRLELLDERRFAGGVVYARYGVRS